MNTKTSKTMHEEALLHIVGGVNSPSRSFLSVGGEYPITMLRGQGAYLWDVDGNRYIDYLGAYGPIIVGHAHPYVTAAIVKAVEEGPLLGTPTPWEMQFAKTLKRTIPSMDYVRFVNSGTEAVMTVIRVARAFTGRTKIVKFAGCYHGHSDPVLVAAGSGPATLGIPESAGVPAGTAAEVITVPYNDEDALREALERWSEQVAAVLIEPIVGNFGIVMPKPGYLEALCRMARDAGALVIYDEVISAFRFHFGAAHNSPFFPDHAAIEPDLTALGKIIGGGLPIGAYGGRREILERVAPLGPVYQAGTMAGNPASVRAGIACLKVLEQPNVYEHLETLGQRLENGLLEIARRRGVPLTVNRCRGALSAHFCDHPVTNYEEAKKADSRLFGRFFLGMLEAGVCLAPSKYEAWFITLAHTEADIDYTLDAADRVFAAW